VVGERAGGHRLGHDDLQARPHAGRDARAAAAGAATRRALVRVGARGACGAEPSALAHRRRQRPQRARQPARALSDAPGDRPGPLRRRPRGPGSGVAPAGPAPPHRPRGRQPRPGHAAGLPPRARRQPHPRLYRSHGLVRVRSGRRRLRHRRPDPAPLPPTPPAPRAAAPLPARRADRPVAARGRARAAAAPQHPDRRAPGDLRGAACALQPRERAVGQRPGHPGLYPGLLHPDHRGVLRRAADAAPHRRRLALGARAERLWAPRPGGPRRRGPEARHRHRSDAGGGVPGLSAGAQRLHRPSVRRARLPALEQRRGPPRGHRPGRALRPPHRQRPPGLADLHAAGGAHLLARVLHAAARRPDPPGQHAPDPPRGPAAAGLPPGQRVPPPHPPGRRGARLLGPRAGAPGGVAPGGARPHPGARPRSAAGGAAGSPPLRGGRHRQPLRPLPRRGRRQRQGPLPQRLRLRGRRLARRARRSRRPPGGPPGGLAFGAPLDRRPPGQGRLARPQRARAARRPREHPCQRRALLHPPHLPHPRLPPRPARLGRGRRHPGRRAPHRRLRAPQRPVHHLRHAAPPAAPVAHGLHHRGRPLAARPGAAPGALPGAPGHPRGAGAAHRPAPAHRGRSRRWPLGGPRRAGEPPRRGVDRAAGRRGAALQAGARHGPLLQRRRHRHPPPSAR
jgi:hypothetical protein